MRLTIKIQQTQPGVITMIPQGPLDSQTHDLLDSVNQQDMGLDEFERKHIIDILSMTGWRVRGKNGAAEILRLKPSTLESKMQKLGIKRPPNI